MTGAPRNRPAPAPVAGVEALEVPETVAAAESVSGAVFVSGSQSTDLEPAGGEYR